MVVLPQPDFPRHRERHDTQTAVATVAGGDFYRLIEIESHAVDHTRRQNAKYGVLFKRTQDPRVSVYYERCTFTQMQKPCDRIDIRVGQNDAADG